MGIRGVFDRLFKLGGNLRETKKKKMILMIHKIAGKPGILELAKLVETKMLAQLAEDTEAGSLHASLSQSLHNRLHTEC